ncbi:hypothetical protein LPB03_12445 [Polaribacter vadi]|uniref:DoxX family protein n=1 Tax=Polaribacter vadi TaxID=1774273 RepID=A0A1B8TTF5_9FLAO|nr:hypothetical protein [Polaribacter vadi]AOW18208.1 hypothetical protein LPB03_12445 [Polaribacter vadi]OBY62940.1 hypothetical protein LPB3_12460 [Polaribacter vadi]|tara:strand:- start:156 stop:509 length:354 start_codon:yes stop_codon:yes gene_type:complete
MKYFYALLLIFHGLLHLIGFIKAFFTTEIFKGLLSISKPMGALWLLTFLLFLYASSALLNNKKWINLIIIAVCLSQYLIIMDWKDAKLGTILNIIVLTIAIIGYNRKRHFKAKESNN